MSSRPYIAAYKGKSFVSRQIKWFTWSEYSHVAYVYEDGTCVEAWHKGGVQRNISPGILHSPGTVIEFYELPRPNSIISWSQELAEQFFEEQIGKKYDFPSVFRFLTRRRESDASQHKWFCSELVFAVMRSAGLRLLHRIAAYKVTPGHIVLSPFLQYSHTETVTEAEYVPARQPACC